MLLVILTETKRRGVVPRGHLCSGGGQGCRCPGPHRGTQGQAAVVQMVPPPPPAPHRVWAPSDVHHGKVREAPAQSGLWGGSGTFKSSAQGAVDRDRRPPASVRRAGQPAAPLCPLNHGSVRWGDWRRGSLCLQTPWSPGRKVLLEPGAAFWFSLAVWVRS